MKIWQKFHSLYGCTLKVALENDFLPGMAAGLDPRYKDSGLLYTNKFEEQLVEKVYEPALKIAGPDENNAVQIFFEPIIFPEPRYRRLMFFKEICRDWLVAARHGEESVFGFDAKNSRHLNYLPIAYPGLSGQFIQLYFKIKERGLPDVYLEVWAWDEDKTIIVQCRHVLEEEAPDILILAKPSAIVIVG